VTDALAALARTTVKLRLHRLEVGRYPESLEALGRPEFDPFSGESLRYARAGEGFVLESAGVELAGEKGRRLTWRVER